MSRAYFFGRVEDPSRKLEGGYAPLSVILIALDWWSHRERLIYTTSFRAWLAGTAQEFTTRLHLAGGEAQP